MKVVYIETSITMLRIIPSKIRTMLLDLLFFLTLTPVIIRTIENINPRNNINKNPFLSSNDLINGSIFVTSFLLVNSLVNISSIKRSTSY